MNFVIGYALGSIVTFYLFYRMEKKKKAEAEKKTVSNAQSSNIKNNEEGDEEEL